MHVFSTDWARDSVAKTASRYGPDVRCSNNGVGNFLVPLLYQTGPGAHPASCTLRTGELPQG